jgi:hypothetical protein
MSAVSFRLLGPAPPQPLQRPVDPIRLLEMRARLQLAIADIDRALSRPRLGRIERRSSAPAVDQRPVGVPIEYHCAGRILGVR